MPKVERNFKHNRNERRNENDPLHQYKALSKMVLQLRQEPINKPDIVSCASIIKALNDLEVNASKKGYDADGEEESEFEANLCDSESEEEVHALLSSHDTIAPIGANDSSEGGE